MTVENLETVRCPLCGSNKGDALFEWRRRTMVRCSGCSLVYRNPRPTVFDVRRAYAADGTDLGLEERVARRRSHEFRRFFDSFPADRPGRLLDVGCGYGFFLKMAEERGWKAVGLDLNPKAVDYAKERLRVNAILGDLNDIPFPDESFDLVTLWNVVECVPDPLELLRQLRPVLREEGTIFIRTQNEKWQFLSFRLTSLLPRLGWGNVFEDHPFATFVFHMASFSRFTLRLLIEQAGFVPLSIKNSKPTQGDPYLGLGSRGELLLTLIKLTVHGLAQSAYHLSGGRWLIGPSLEAWGRRKKIHESLKVSPSVSSGESHMVSRTDATEDHPSE